MDRIPPPFPPFPLPSLQPPAPIQQSSNTYHPNFTYLYPSASQPHSLTSSPQPPHSHSQANSYSPEQHDDDGSGGGHDGAGNRRAYAEMSSGVGEPGVAGQPPRKRPKYTRSKAGCLTCRTKKIKCDEMKPVCTRCHQSHRECLWPPEPTLSRRKPGHSVGGTETPDREHDRRAGPYPNPHHGGGGRGGHDTPGTVSGEDSGWGSALGASPVFRSPMPGAAQPVGPAPTTAASLAAYPFNVELLTSLNNMYAQQQQQEAQPQQSSQQQLNVQQQLMNGMNGMTNLSGLSTLNDLNTLNGMMPMGTNGLSPSLSHSSGGANSLSMSMPGFSNSPHQGNHSRSHSGSGSISASPSMPPLPTPPLSGSGVAGPALPPSTTPPSLNGNTTHLNGNSNSTAQLQSIAPYPLYPTNLPLTFPSPQIHNSSLKFPDSSGLGGWYDAASLLSPTSGSTSFPFLPSFPTTNTNNSSLFTNGTNGFPFAPDPTQAGFVPFPNPYFNIGLDLDPQILAALGRSTTTPDTSASASASISSSNTLDSTTSTLVPTHSPQLSYRSSTAEVAPSSGQWSSTISSASNSREEGGVVGPAGAAALPPGTVPEGWDAASAGGQMSQPLMVGPDPFEPYFQTIEERNLIRHYCNTATKIIMAVPSDLNPVLAINLPLVLSHPPGTDAATEALRLSLLGVGAIHQAYLLSRHGVPGHSQQEMMSLAMTLRLTATHYLGVACRTPKGMESDAALGASVTIALIDIFTGGQGWTANLALAKTLVDLRGGPRSIIAQNKPHVIDGGAKVSPARLLLEYLAVYDTFGSLTTGDPPSILGPGSEDWWFNGDKSSYHLFSVEKVFGMSRAMIELVARVSTLASRAMKHRKKIVELPDDDGVGPGEGVEDDESGAVAAAKKTPEQREEEERHSIEAEALALYEEAKGWMDPATRYRLHPRVENGNAAHRLAMQIILLRDVLRVPRRDKRVQEAATNILRICADSAKRLGMAVDLTWPTIVAGCETEKADQDAVTKTFEGFREQCCFDIDTAEQIVQEVWRRQDVDENDPHADWRSVTEEFDLKVLLL